MCEVAVTRGQHCLYVCGIVVIISIVVRVTLDDLKGGVKESVRILTVWTLGVIAYSNCVACEGSGF